MSFAEIARPFVGVCRFGRLDRTPSGSKFSDYFIPFSLPNVASVMNRSPGSSCSNVSSFVTHPSTRSNGVSSRCRSRKILFLPDSQPFGSPRFDSSICMNLRSSTEMQNQTKKVSLVLGAMLTGALLTGVVVSLPEGMRGDVYADQQAQARVAQQNLAQQNLSTAQDLSTAFRNVAEALKPSVVSISTSKSMLVGGRGGRGGFDGIPPELRRNLPPGFDDFFDFGTPDRGNGRSQPQRRRQQTGMGSGVIVRDDGYVLTNNHVVAGADEVTVELSDGRELTAEVVGTDPPTDRAVLKIEADQLQPVTFGNSDKIQVGDWVLAIGSPFGLDQTVTAGIISGKNRVRGIVSGDRGFEDFLQTDAAINPGNSGGPLVNLRGEVVGINTAIISRSGGYNGIGFAIPTTLARPVLESIIESGTVERGFLGARSSDNGEIPDAVLERDNLSSRSGAYIESVVAGGPADKGGLQAGDIV